MNDIFSWKVIGLCYLYALAGIGFGFLMSAVWLLNIGSVAEIITAGSIGFAVFTYYYQKHKDNTDAAIQQVSFYRKEIIRTGRELYKHARESIKKDDTYTFTRIESIPDLNMEWIRMHRRNESDEQLKPFEKDFALQQEVEDFINLLEDLSVQIIHTETINHPAIATIRPGFVAHVETLASIIATYKFRSNDLYNATTKVYEVWKDKIDRDNLEEKLLKTKKSLERRKEQGEKPTSYVANLAKSNPSGESQ